MSNKNPTKSPMDIIEQLIDEQYIDKAGEWSPLAEMFAELTGSD